MKRLKPLISVTLLFAGYVGAYAQPTTYGLGAGTGGNATNSYYGQSAGASNTTGQGNTFMGLEAGRLTTSNLNTFIGNWSGDNNTTGELNTFVGDQTGYSNVDGTANTFLGRGTGTANVSGNDNTLVGVSAGYQSTGSGNTFVGEECGIIDTRGSNNTLLGHSSNCWDNLTNATAIGYNAIVASSNSMILGSPEINVGIGINSPVKKLTISSNAVNDGIRITQRSDGYGYAGIELMNETTNGNNWGVLSLGNGNTQGVGNFMIYNYTHSRSDINISGTTGNVAVGTTSAGAYKLYVNGSVYSTTGYSSSDLRFKKDIRPVDNALSLITSLNGVSYTFRDDLYLSQNEGSTDKPQKRNFPAGKQLGLIAQDVEKVLPEVVSTDNEGYKAIAYQNIIPVLIEGIKEQQQQIATLQATVNDLKQSMAECCAKSTGANNLNTDKASLEQNVPNPLDNSTLIRYYLPQSSANATIQVVNSEGKIMLSQRLAQTGNGQFTIETASWASGTYSYQLSVNGNPVDTKKMVVVH